MMIRGGVSIGIMRMWAGMLLYGILNASGAPAELPPLPEISISACEMPPKLDGVLDDACWKTAAMVEKLNVYRKDETTDAVAFKLAFDNQWLYIAAQIRHPMPERIKPKVLEQDGGVTQDDSLEIFIDPGTDGRLYYHYMLNAANVRAEQQKTRNASGDYAGDRNWDIPWRSAVRITEQGWQAEIALPLSVLAAHGRLDKLRINLCGAICIPVIDPQGVEVYQDRLFFTWSPLFRQFHEPFRFGCLRGLEEIIPRTPFLAALHAAAAGSYMQTNGRYGYALSAELRVLTPNERDLEIRAADLPLGGEPSRLSERLSVKGPSVRAVRLFLPVARLSSRTARLELADAATGEVLQVVHVTRTEHLTLLSGVFADRSYYTDESAARIRAAVALPPEAMAGMTAAVRDTSGRILGRAASMSACPTVTVSLTDIPAGAHAWEFVLLDASGKTVIRREFECVKRAHRPGREWKLDRFDLVLLNNGRPFFPIGVVFSGTNEKHFAEVAAAGMNSVLRWNSSQNPTNAADFHEQAARHGLLVVEPVDRYAGANLIGQKASPDFPALVDKNMDRMLLGVENVKNLPSLMAYFHFDEPGWEHQIEPGRKLYRAVNALDGYHPWVVLYSSHIPPGEKWLDWSDIVGTDPYWIPNGEQPKTGVRGTVNWMSKITTWTRRRGDALGHPTWIVPVGELWSGMRRRVLLPEEQLCQSYLAVIHGAKALFYFAYPYKHALSMGAMRQLGDEFRQIGPLAVTPEIPQTIAYQPGRYDPDADQYPAVQVSLRRGADGTYVLLAANASPGPVAVRFGIAGLPDGQVVTRWFGPEKYPVQDGMFGEKLPAYAVRAYVVDAPDLPIPAAVKVDMQPFPAETDPRYAAPAQPDAGRPGKRNLVRNPSFEEATLPDWPDYYMALYDQFGRTDTGPLGAGTGMFAVDTNNAWHGSASFRVQAQQGSWRRWLSWWSGFGFTLVPRVEKPTPYVFSVYMKAERDGMVVRLCGFDDAAQLDAPEAKDFPEFQLTREWRRYSHTGMLTPMISPYHVFGLRVLGEGAVWVDAIQIEPGAEPTDFEP